MTVWPIAWRTFRERVKAWLTTKAGYTEAEAERALNRQHVTMQLLHAADSTDDIGAAVYLSKHIQMERQLAGVLEHAREQRQTSNDEPRANVRVPGRKRGRPRRVDAQPVPAQASDTGLEQSRQADTGSVTTHANN